MKIKIDKLNLFQASKCFTNQELCGKAGIGMVTLVKVKNGTQKPTLKTIGLLAKALEVNVTDLIEQED